MRGERPATDSVVFRRHERKQQAPRVYGSVKHPPHHRVSPFRRGERVAGGGLCPIAGRDVKVRAAKIPEDPRNRVLIPFDAREALTLQETAKIVAGSFVQRRDRLR